MLHELFLGQQSGLDTGRLDRREHLGSDGFIQAQSTGREAPRRTRSRRLLVQT
jgi:hypothetical protein